MPLSLTYNFSRNSAGISCLSDNKKTDNNYLHKEIAQSGNFV